MCCREARTRVTGLLQIKLFVELSMTAAALDECVEATNVNVSKPYDVLYQWSMQTTTQAHVIVVTG